MDAHARTWFWIVLVVICSLAAGCGNGGAAPRGDDGGDDDDEVPGSTPAPLSGQYVVLAANDLGMHCVDNEFSVFAMLPPFNVVQAQVVRRGTDGHPRLLDGGTIEVRYAAVADASGSTNTTSLGGKTDFWTHAEALFGLGLRPGEGLLGVYMPSDAPIPGAQALTYEGSGLFLAPGIPVLPLDDLLGTNPYPLFRILAVDPATGGSLTHTDVVVPVSGETDCSGCHVTGGIGSQAIGVAWSTDPDLEIQTKTNILRLHDHETGTDLSNHTPVLCARCHYSAALDLAGSGPAGDQVGHPTFSSVMHYHHGGLEDAQGQLVFPAGGNAADTCYRCHPGTDTECYRGAMKTGGMECYSCHGDMLDVGAEHVLAAGGSLGGTNDGGPRRPWVDLPRCQSCHTGDALDHLTGSGLVVATDGIRLRQAWRSTDLAASPILATNRRFAENDGTLYRHSRGHGGLLCTACHGSPHAIWPNAGVDANDNVAALAMQGHAGTLSSCFVCHDPDHLGPTMGGPHGMHNVGDARWTDHAHEEFFERDPDACRRCHGADLGGTVLSRTAVDRLYEIEDDPVFLAKGTPVGCTHCHGRPDIENEEED